MIAAKVELTQPLKQQRQFVAPTEQYFSSERRMASSSAATSISMPVGAMVQKTASFHTTYEIVEDKTEWMKPAQAAGVQA